MKRLGDAGCRSNTCFDVQSKASFAPRDGRVRVGKMIDREIGRRAAAGNSKDI
jgi:hypothetical protein